MSTNLVAKPRRFRITLWSLDSDLNPVEELTEVLSFQATFSMGSIPMASVGPPHGIEVHTDRYSEIINKLDKMVKDKAPLGVVVERAPEVLHATTSDLNDDDPDCKWPKEKVIVFKGYAAARAFSKNSQTISSTLFSLTLPSFSKLIKTRILPGLQPSYDSLCYKKSGPSSKTL